MLSASYVADSTAWARTLSSGWKQGWMIPFMSCKAAPAFVSSAQQLINASSFAAGVVGKLLVCEQGAVGAARAIAPMLVGSVQLT
jgi:hypothetical protein